MKNALVGLITGFAQGTSARITEERLEEKTLLANRFKMAAVNKKQRDAEDKEKTAIAQRRNDQINTFFGSASEGQKLALLSNETMFNLAIENKDNLAGPSNQSKLDEFIVLKEGEIPENFKVAKDYATRLKSMPAKMPDMQTREVFFSKVTPDQREMDGMAAAFGTPSAANLLSYENMPDDVADPVFGSVNLDAIKAPEKIEDQIDKARQSLVGATPEEAAALKLKIEELIVHQNVGLSPKTLTADAERISLRMKTATGTELVNLKAELAKVNGLIRSNTRAQNEAKQAGGDALTFPQRNKIVQDAQVSALENMIGLSAIDQNKLLETRIDPFTGAETRKMRSLKPTDLPLIWKIAKESALQSIKDLGQLKADGTYTEEAIGILIGLGLYRNGEIVEGPTEDTTTEAQKTAQLAASRAAEAAKIQGVGGASKPAAAAAPVAPTTTAAMATARRQAQQAIAAGAVGVTPEQAAKNKASVRKMFKETTGQDL
jgi:hypothetical protein